MNWRVPAIIPLPADFKGFDPASRMGPADFHRYERHLPHWRLPGTCYFSTFRLNDSIPTESANEMRDEAEAWRLRLAQAAAGHQGQIPSGEHRAWIEFQRVQLRKLESLADEGHGECLLRDGRLRQVVDSALHYFEGARCEMFAFVIMPNHVHVLCRPLGGHDVENLTGSWKRHSAERINRVSGRKGTLWQQETFDRIIRDAGHFRRAMCYIAENPVKARLREDEASVWFGEAVCKANEWDADGGAKGES